MSASRIIKFRAQNCGNGKWEYGSGIASVGNVTWLIQSDKDGYYGTRIKAETVGQFIGLQDKNGNEIYEGDILSNGSPQTMTVIYRKSQAAFMGVTDYLEPYQTTREWLLGQASESLEIIDNIHDKRKKR